MKYLIFHRRISYVLIFTNFGFSRLPKVFESLFCDFVSPILDPVLIDHQFGFRPRRSTKGNLLTHIDYLSNALENGHQVDTIYTDFSKAFDRVSHDILLNKLRVLGLNMV